MIDPIAARVIEALKATPMGRDPHQLLAIYQRAQEICRQQNNVTGVVQIQRLIDQLLGQQASNATYAGQLQRGPDGIYRVKQ